MSSNYSGSQMSVAPADDFSVIQYAIQREGGFGSLAGEDEGLLIARNQKRTWTVLPDSLILHIKRHNDIIRSRLSQGLKAKLFHLTL
ncbi:hypothetical protein J23TS9_15740 [Paenibacillus sp. J23TS9]|nr:hypothetical protein J23TS9_15740 [Paenibacillus sp. J23TS9]